MKMPKQLLCVLLISTLLACSGRTAPPPPQEPAKQRVNRLFDQIQIGDSKESVEKLLGQPFSYEKNLQGETSMYMTGMEDMMAQMQALQSGTQGASMVSGLMGSVSGLAGLAGPGAGIAAGIGSEVVGMGTSLAMQANQPKMPDMGDIQMLMITYQNGKVISVQRQSPGQMGMGVNPTPEPNSED